MRSLKQRGARDDTSPNASFGNVKIRCLSALFGSMQTSECTRGAGAASASPTGRYPWRTDVAISGARGR